MDKIHRFIFNITISLKAILAYLTPSFYLLTKILLPILQVLFYSLVAKYALGSSDITPYIIGNGIILSTRNAVYGVGTILRGERSTGTLRNIIASPTNKFSLFLSRGIVHVIDAFITIIVVLLIAIFFFNIHIPKENLIVFLIVLIISLFSAMSIGQLISSFGLITTDIHMFLNTCEFILLILTGALFPLDNLPLFLQKVSYIIPLTRSIKVAQSLLGSYEGLNIITMLGTEIFMSLSYLLLSYVLFKYFEVKSVKEATIDIY